MMMGIITLSTTGCGSDKLSCTYDEGADESAGISTVGVNISFKDKKASSGEGYITFTDSDKAEQYYSLFTSMSDEDNENYKLNGNKIVVKFADEDFEDYDGKTKDEVKELLIDEGYTCK